MHHPWRAFRELVDWTVEWAHLPEGLLGLTLHGSRRVVLTRGMTQVERRCTLEHERHHALRGPAVEGYEDADERAVRSAAARTLITFERLVDAMLWANDDHELADELWVDLDTVRDRLAGLTASESAELSRRIIQAESGHP